LFGMTASSGYFKDAFHDYVVHGDHAAVNPARRGTKAAAHYEMSVSAGSSSTVRLRLSNAPQPAPFAAFDGLLEQRRRETDEFFGEWKKAQPEADARAVQRQVWAGMIGSKQYYHYDVRKWLEGAPAEPAPPAQRRRGRNWHWVHFNCADILSMPDK